MANRKNKAKIKKLIKGELAVAYREIKLNIDKVLNSKAVDVDIDEWDEKNHPMVLPKIITMALLEDGATMFQGKGTGIEHVIKKKVKEIRYYI